MVDLNMKVKTINLLEENRIFLGLQIYFASTPNTDHKTNKKKDKSDYIKSKSFSSLKDTILKRKVTK